MLRLGVLPDSKLVAHTAARTIFTLDTLTFLRIVAQESHSEEFYVEMAECSSSSKVGYHLVFALRLDRFTRDTAEEYIFCS